MDNVENTELITLLSKLDKKVDKLLTLNTKIAKCLHLIPVTEKEEREIQALQRKNLQIAAKVNEDLSNMANEPEPFAQLTFGNLQVDALFADVLAEDFLPKT